jgi:hypothetical protein
MSHRAGTLTLQEEAIPLVRSGLAMKKMALEFNLRRYSERLKRFEHRKPSVKKGNLCLKE